MDAILILHFHQFYWPFWRDFLKKGVLVLVPSGMSSKFYSGRLDFQKVKKKKKKSLFFWTCLVLPHTYLKWLQAMCSVLVSLISGSRLVFVIQAFQTVENQHRMDEQRLDGHWISLFVFRMIFIQTLNFIWTQQLILFRHWSSFSFWHWFHLDTEFSLRHWFSFRSRLVFVIQTQNGWRNTRWTLNFIFCFHNDFQSDTEFHLDTGWTNTEFHLVSTVIFTLLKFTLIFFHSLLFTLNFIYFNFGFICCFHFDFTCTHFEFHSLFPEICQVFTFVFTNHLVVSVLWVFTVVLLNLASGFFVNWMNQNTDFK